MGLDRPVRVDSCGAGSQRLVEAPECLPVHLEAGAASSRWWARLLHLRPKAEGERPPTSELRWLGDQDVRTEWVEVIGGTPARDKDRNSPS